MDVSGPDYVAMYGNEDQNEACGGGLDAHCNADQSIPKPQRDFIEVESSAGR